jgi:KUP system potassium uptake protein
VFFVLPALMLSYLGQGALVLGEPAAISNPFFHLAPGWASFPRRAATAATVIAAQAVITGAFAEPPGDQLGLLPRRSLHLRSQCGPDLPAADQRDPPLGVLLLVGLFRVGALAGAYGIAVSGTMVVTALLLF